MTVPPPPRATGFYDPRTYDWEIGSSLSRADRRRFYVTQVSRPGARVLELGCGTGDIALAIAQHGAHVIGLDSSPEMIKAAADKAHRRGCTTTRWVQGRMESFAFHTRFTAVIIPYHALCHVLSQTALGELLARVHYHLEPGGAFVADIFTRPPGAPLHRRASHSTRTPDGIYDVVEDEHFNPATGRLRTRFTYRLEHPHSGQIIDTWTRHLDYLVAEPDVLTGRLRHAGFMAVTHFAAFDHRKPAAPGEDVVLRGVRSPSR
jgi:ubiquinone/menaquinone biosynthesis C-methylase UbiE